MRNKKKDEKKDKKDVKKEEKKESKAGAPVKIEIAQNMVMIPNR